MKALELQINGKKYRVETEPDSSLLAVLRDDLDMTGTKYGCGEGQCGACTVLIDGNPVRSCLVEAGNAAGKQITTIEGIEQNGRLHPLQQAFIEAGAMQCGYCIPGMIMSAQGLLKKNPRPTEQEIIRAMEGNICRCGTHPRIAEAIRRIARSSGARKGGAR
ncbi:MAG TPA: (2Fe-2S)-binding protein [Blastocatellia bacterium]|jgi:aerobic-type carbon monoxide dehydrogenase small subunit (CoxS/CutS family)